MQQVTVQTRRWVAVAAALVPTTHHTPSKIWTQQASWLLCRLLCAESQQEDLDALLTRLGPFFNDAMPLEASTAASDLPDCRRAFEQMQQR